MLIDIILFKYILIIIYQDYQRIKLSYLIHGQWYDSSVSRPNCLIMNEDSMLSFILINLSKLMMVMINVHWIGWRLSLMVKY